MKTILRNLFLVILILLPIFIIFFLHSFGENRFDVPVLFKNGERERETDCELSTEQHIVPQIKPDLDYNGHLTVLYFSTGDKSLENFDATAFYRLCDKSDNILRTLFISPTEVNSKVCSELNYLSVDNIENLMNCGFIIDFNEFVLVDGGGRIRGYFENETKDIDRLFTELRILRENGEYEK